MTSGKLLYPHQLQFHQEDNNISADFIGFFPEVNVKWMVQQ